jgi:hypothetical protein
MLRDTAHEQAAQPRPAMGAHNNEITPALMCDSCDYPGGIPGYKKILDRDIGRRRRNVPMKVLLEPLLVRLRLELSRRFAVRNVLGTERFDNMKHEDRSLVLLSQVDGNVECLA